MKDYEPLAILACIIGGMVIALCLLTCCDAVAQIGTEADPYVAAFGDTLQISWDTPPTQPVVRWYKFYHNDGSTNIVAWMSGSERSTTSLFAYMSTALHRCWLTAGNDAGESGPSNYIYLRVTEAVPMPPRIIDIIIKRRI